jgi:hypothetical protein
MQLQWRYFHYATALQEQSLTTLHAIQNVSPSGASICRYTQKGNTPKGTTQTITKASIHVFINPRKTPFDTHSTQLPMYFRVKETWFCAFIALCLYNAEIRELSSSKINHKTSYHFIVSIHFLTTIPTWTQYSSYSLNFVKPVSLVDFEAFQVPLHLGAQINNCRF